MLSSAPSIAPGRGGQDGKAFGFILISIRMKGCSLAAPKTRELLHEDRDVSLP